jgi:hypothetical protein
MTIIICKQPFINALIRENYLTFTVTEISFKLPFVNSSIWVSQFTLAVTEIPASFTYSVNFNEPCPRSIQSLSRRSG